MPALAFILTTLDFIGFRSPITDIKTYQYLGIAVVDGCLERLHELQRLLTDNTAIEVRVLRTVRKAPQGGDGNAFIPRTLSGFDGTRTIQITDTGGDQVEVGIFMSLLDMVFLLYWINKSIEETPNPWGSCSPMGD